MKFRLVLGVGCPGTSQSCSQTSDLKGNSCHDSTQNHVWSAKPPPPERKFTEKPGQATHNASLSIDSATHQLVMTLPLVDVK